MNAVFVAPFFLEATTRFIAAVAELDDVRLGVVSQDPEENLPDGVRARMVAHYRIDDGTDVDAITHAVQLMQRHLGGVDRLIGTLEQLQVPLAAVRERLGIPGVGVEVARNFRDKNRMKDVFDAHGIPCAGHRLATSADAARAAAEALGLPVVAKPPAGAGAHATFRIDEMSQLNDWLHLDPPTPEAPVLFEQVLRGEEHSFDSVFLDGRLHWYSISRYLPTPLEVLENPWIQWAVLLPREIGGPSYEAARETGVHALQALGMDTGLTHMEWFLRGGTDAAISEVAARPPGAQFMTLMSYAHDLDMYAAWARLEVFHAFAPPERRYAAGAAYLRGQGAGQVHAILGLDVLQRELGDLVVEARLPERGQAPGGGYEGEGYVIVRDEATGVVEAALRRIVDVARVVLAAH